MLNKILLSPPHMSGKEQKYIQKAFEENWISPLGPNVTEFEKRIADYDRIDYAVATSSGTAAIHLALATLGVKKDDIVFCQSFTFVASATPIQYLGAHPVFIDSETDTWNMSPLALQKALEVAKKRNQLPKAIIVVHLFGQSAKMNELLEIANAYKVPIIEDAAESLGTTYGRNQSGTMGLIGIHSFNGNKMITTSGGGCLVTDDPDIRTKAMFLATQAKDNKEYYHHSELGYNYRLSNVSAGIGCGQMEVLPTRVKQRQNIFKKYRVELGSLPGIEFQPEEAISSGNRWLTTLIMEKVNPWEIIHYLQDRGIESRALWQPLHQQPLFVNDEFYTHESGGAVSSKLFIKGLCLPSGSQMNSQDQERVINAIKRFWKERGI